MFIIPSFLKRGDLVLVIATARARNEAQVAPAIKILKEQGFEVETGAMLYKVHHQFAGTDNERASDLQWALDHPKAKAILISGGGYGALRIIDRVNFESFTKNPKWLIGYSDTTVMHSRLSKLGIAAIHATMAFQFTRDKVATASLFHLLKGEELKYNIPANPLNRSGKARGIVVGGNLSLLYALKGSQDDLDTDGKILFIEDLDEQLYHVDRMVRSLKRSGKLSKLAGLVVGGMTEMKDNTVPFGQSAEEIIREAVDEYLYPVCFDFPAGHIERNMSLYFGVTADLEVTKNKIEFSYIK